MKVIANIKYLRISVKKLKTLAGKLVGSSVVTALDRLTLINNKSSKILLNALKSAKANAVNNSKLDGDKLVISRIEANKGPILKRWNPVSRGMAHQIRKDTSHVRITLEEKIFRKSAKTIKKSVVNIKENPKKELKGTKNGT